jgi:hypothetical protein
MEFVLNAHSIVRYLVLIFGIWAVFNALSGVIKSRPYTGTDDKSNLFFMIFTDIQFLLGIILLFTWINQSGVLDLGMGTVMKDKVMRFKTVEHPVMMLLAWVMVHISRSSVKKAVTDASKHKKTLIFSGIALLLILAAIPWPFREIIGRPWF